MIITKKYPLRPIQSAFTLSIYTFSFNVQYIILIDETIDQGNNHAFFSILVTIPINSSEKILKSMKPVSLKTLVNSICS